VDPNESTSEHRTKHQIARAAVLCGAASLIPVPFVDDLVAERARRDMLAALLASRGRKRAAKELPALWEDQGGCLSGCLMLPIKILLIPIKKLLRSIFFVFAVRALALEVAHALHLGRAIERCLDRGLLGDELLPEQAREQAARVRVAFESAFRGVDLAVLKHSLAAAFTGLRGIWSRLRRGARTEHPEAADAAAVEGTTEKVEEVVAAQEREGYFQEFDQKFDRALDAVTPPPSSPK
jgi:hypothetical protein